MTGGRRAAARRGWWATGLLGLLTAGSAPADESVVHSKHDLSVFGPGPVRAVNEGEVCIFCHAPHNASPQAPLWNRHNPTAYYRIYSSSTTDARIDQPGGPSKMCLSCHDGSIALGLVLSRPPTDPIPMNQPFLPSGPANLTNDLSDDHPIGFRYDRQLANRDRQLRSPDLVDSRVKLGDRGQLECTACHDPHNNALGDFLRVTDRQGALCNTCHRMEGWERSSHAASPRTVPLAVTSGLARPFRSMAENACASCHLAHNAPHRERLLRNRPFDLCITCHDGLGGRNLLDTLNPRSGHTVQRLADLHDPRENPLVMPQHVECVDCHNPHSVRPSPLSNPLLLGAARGPILPGAMHNVPGVSLAGVPIQESRFYYEVCFRCHADNPARTQRIPRQVETFGNIRRQLLPTAASAHPITVPSLPGGETPSLLPQFRTPLTIGCQDCHNNPDARQLGGASANGPHGSRFPFLLAARYETADFTMESPQAYALCYQCHDRTSILADQSFTLHQRHIVTGRTPCSACHAPHGVGGSRTNHDHLINFDLSIVGGQRRYEDTGLFRGSCTLTCHGVNHVNFTYGTP
jgi:predicted CXXCH cytochrome family protein